MKFGHACMVPCLLYGYIQMKNKPKLVIIGKGIIGSLIGYALREEFDITFLYNPTGTASSAAGAMINVIGELEADKLTGPYLTKTSLLRQSHNLWLKLLPQTTNNTTWGSHTTIMSPNRATDLLKKSKNNFKAIKQDLSAFVDKRTGDIRLTEAWVESRGMLDWLDNEYKNLNSFWQPGVYSSNQIDTHKKIIYTEGGSFTYNKLIIADGVQTPATLKAGMIRLDKDLDIICSKGIAATVNITNPEPNPRIGVTRTANFELACGLHLIRMAIDVAYLGSTAEFMFSPRVGLDLDKIQSLTTNFKALFPGLMEGVTVQQWKYGFRPVSTDLLPIIGPIDEDIFIATGTNREGFAMAPVIAEYVKAWLECKHTDNKWLAFDPMRTPYRREITKADVNILSEVLGATQYNEVNSSLNKLLDEQHNKIHNLEMLKAYYENQLYERTTQYHDVQP